MAERRTVSSDPAMTPIVTRAAVVREAGRVALEPLLLAAPGRDEIRVRIAGVGICHTDLACRDQKMPVPLPIVLGHEGAGVVEAVGVDVHDVQPGDHVVLSFASCGACASCRGAQPAYCEHAAARNYAGRRPDGSAALRTTDGAAVGSHFFGQSSFSEHVLAAARTAVVIDKDLPLALMGPLGCSVQTGAGAVLEALALGAGQSLAVFGVGAVGLCAVMAAAALGCTPIIAVDRNPARLELALALGATQVFDAAQPELARRLRKAGGVDAALDCVGAPEVFETAYAILKPRGTLGLLGVPAAQAEARIALAPLLFGRRVRGIIEGDAEPRHFIPRLLAMHRAGQLPFERLIRTYPLDAIDTAIADMQAGRVIKPVLLPGAA